MTEAKRLQDIAQWFAKMASQATLIGHHVKDGVENFVLCDDSGTTYILGLQPDSRWPTKEKAHGT